MLFSPSERECRVYPLVQVARHCIMPPDTYFHIALKMREDLSVWEFRAEPKVSSSRAVFFFASLFTHIFPGNF